MPLSTSVFPTTPTRLCPPMQSSRRFLRSDKPKGVSMDLRIEVLVLPVSDVDRAKTFYEKLGFHVDVDYASGDYRILQLTPPGSELSIIFGKGVTCAQPGSVDR